MPGANDHIVDVVKFVPDSVRYGRKVHYAEFAKIDSKASNSPVEGFYPLAYILVFVFRWNVSCANSQLDLA